jgi:hypothetical protein
MGCGGRYFYVMRRKWQEDGKICIISVFTISVPPSTLCLWSEDDERGKACGTYEERRDTYIFVVGKPEGRRPLDRPRRRSKNKIIIDLPEIVLEGLTVTDLACIGTTYWLFWTRWWILWFHDVPGLPWLAEEITGFAEGQCCMEFRRTALLNVLSLSFGLFT